MMKTFLGFPVVAVDDLQPKGDWTLRGVTPAEAEEMARQIVRPRSESMNMDVNTLIAEAHKMGVEAGLAMERWPKPIPISEPMPEDCQRVLVFIQGKWRSADCHNGDVCDVDGIREGYESDMTHWLPLPPNPEGTAT